MYKTLIRPLLFSLPPTVSHHLAMVALTPLECITWLNQWVRKHSVLESSRLSTQIQGLHFPSPLGLAAGFDKDAKRPRALASLGFGFLELGTVTAHPQEANPPPHLFRLPTDRALINRLGFPNEGVERVTSRLLPYKDTNALGIPLVMSIGKSRIIPLDPVEPLIADYLTSFQAAQKVADMVAINISSPNTPHLHTLQQEQLAEALLTALVQDNCSSLQALPLLVKISPDLNDSQLESLLAVIEKTGIHGIITTNTTTQRDHLQTNPSHIAAIGAGGLSGPPLRARALDIVRRTRARLGTQPIVIGVGGIETAEHVIDFIRAGANLVQIYTSFIYQGPRTPFFINRKLDQFIQQQGIKHLSELSLH
ncbi:dihydroorotate dehydrogenase (quinone) [Pajaroellobacter abortibovis]|uniref:Dihydroorotate dehydrogenase (quinone) n=1 Tax=Pajaroellobacter abortibovis TaxID=1882918 RepID=A0A1L6MZP7_9BACT|nr:dihydroorotate dehydrogenase (quinone) [Pajaroellobacter abortibovis]